MGSGTKALRDEQDWTSLTPPPGHWALLHPWSPLLPNTCEPLPPAPSSALTHTGQGPFPMCPSRKAFRRSPLLWHHSLPTLLGSGGCRSQSHHSEQSALNSTQDRNEHLLETPAMKTDNFKALCPNSRLPKADLMVPRVSTYPLPLGSQ